MTPPPPPADRVLLVLSHSPVRRLLRDWLGDAGVDVREAPAWEVERVVSAGEADLLVTSAELEGEWGWSEDPRIEVLVLAVDAGDRAAGRQ
ncbi:hypothetical protein [Miltoncostaea marina]|uniref:hypothetical protein n=1 Tax=Miltoncostaea marina TaxID=2843215 RepID=UPI001C3D2836|nr:hypothetical protein [Miltoncostaea marina]